MTVLLIDGVGRVREYEVSHDLPIIRIAMPVPCTAAESPEPPASAPLLPVAEFLLTAEASYPPVYRLRLTQFSN